MNGKLGVFAAIFMVAASPAQAGNYEDGVQIGDQPTMAQEQFRKDQLRIAHQRGYRHEDEHVSGTVFLFKVLSNWRDGVYSGDDSIYYDESRSVEAPRKHRRR